MAGRAPVLPPPGPTKSATRFPWTAIGTLGAVVLFVSFAWLALVDGEPVGAMLVLGPVLLVLSVPLLVRAQRVEVGFDLAGVLLVGLVLRLGLSYVRFLHATDGYRYHVEGVRLAGFYRHLDFSPDLGASVPGTGAMRAISGVLHVATGNDFFATYLVMAWCNFLGCFLLYRALVLAVGDADGYRYARLLMLWPSMVFWPSSLGKDGWMVLTIGLASYGAARVLQRVAGGYTLLAIGLAAGSFVRPHLTLAALVAFVVALLVGWRPASPTAVTPSVVAKAVGIVVVVVIGSLLVSRTQELLNIDDFSASSLETVAATVEGHTAQGGSAFHPPNPRTPGGFVEAAFTVLYRPLPTEARGSEQLLSAAEGVALAVLTVASFRRLLTVPRRLRRQPYVTHALVFVLVWILGFGVIANFGVLARQRTQMLPFFFALLSVRARAMPAARGWLSARPRVPS